MKYHGTSHDHDGSSNLTISNLKRNSSWEFMNHFKEQFYKANP